MGMEVVMKLKKSEVEVSTSRYEFAHGRRPSGFGSWAFQIGPSDRLEDLFWVNQATYGEAKKQAVAEAVRRGVLRVAVCS